MKRQAFKITTTFKFSNGETSSTSTTVNSKAAVTSMTDNIKVWMKSNNRKIITIDVSPI